MTADRLAVELAMEASDRRERSATEAEIRLPRSAMFTARATMRDLEKAGRQDEIEEIGRAISTVAPEWPEAANREDGRAGARSERSSVNSSIRSPSGLRFRRPRRRNRRIPDPDHRRPVRSRDGTNALARRNSFAIATVSGELASAIAILPVDREGGFSVG